MHIRTIPTYLLCCSTRLFCSQVPTTLIDKIINCTRMAVIAGSIYLRQCQIRASWTYIASMLILANAKSELAPMSTFVVTLPNALMHKICCRMAVIEGSTNVTVELTGHIQPVHVDRTKWQVRVSTDVADIYQMISQGPGFTEPGISLMPL